METLVFEPLIPPPVLAALWTLSAAGCLFYAFWRPNRLAFFQRAALGILHFVPLALLLILLHRPTWVRIEGKDGRKPVLSVLLDASASMATEDGPGGTTRYAEAVKTIEGHAGLWRRDFEVRVRRFDKKLHPVVKSRELKETSPIGSLTNLAGAVGGVLADSPKASLALVISDGIHNAPEGDLSVVAREARAEGMPVFTFPLGTDVTGKDIGLTLSASEELAFVRQRVRVPITVTQVGFNGEEVEVQLRFAGETVETRKVRFEESARVADVDFQVSRPKTGLYTFEVRVAPRKGEALTSNNRRRFSLRVVDERVRILFLEGKPYWDSKFLTRVLRRDKNVLLTVGTRMRRDRVVIEPPSQHAEAKPGNGKRVATDAPKLRASPWIRPAHNHRPLEDRRFLSQFQVVMLGRSADGFLTPAAVENLRDWMSRSGGHLICSRGRPVGERTLSPSLNAVLPVVWQSGAERSFRLDLTESGRALSLFDISGSEARVLPDDPGVILRALPSLVTATTVKGERSLTVVLARAEGARGGQPMAVFSIQRYGAGKSVVLEGQGMWRWAFRPPNDPMHGEDLFRSFWANTVRWLAGSNEFLPSQRATLRPGKPLYHFGERPALYVARRASAAPKQASGDARSASSGPVELPKVEIVREDDLGGIDKSFKPVRVVAWPLPKERDLFRADLDPLEDGQYRARLLDESSPAATAFEVLPPLREMLDLRARRRTLEQLAEMTDAGTLSEQDLRGLDRAFHDFVKRHRPGSEAKRPAWDQWWVLFGLFVWLGGNWWLRRIWGAI